MKKILIISHDKIGTKMAGPGIRYHHMAEILSKSFEVTVGFFDRTYLPGKSFKKSYKAMHIDAYNFHEGFEGQDIVIALYLTDPMIDYCNQKKAFMVFDLYAPVPVENLAQYMFSKKDITTHIDETFIASRASYEKFFQNGDLFIYSNRRQLDYWIGYVFGVGTILPSKYIQRPIYDRFLAAPMGIGSSTVLSKSKRSPIKGTIAGISVKDTVILWTGGVWDWFDAQTTIRAMAELKETRPDIKLVFFGTQHPNPSIPKMDELELARGLAIHLNLLSNTVFFQDGWVDYQGRLEYLADADLAIYSHKPSIETEFSHRTRVLDHILAELPTVATAGDYFADEVILPQGIGEVCPAGDSKALSQAILKAAEPRNYQVMKSRITKIRKNFDWENTLKDLEDFLLTNPSKLERVSQSIEIRRDSLAKRIIKRVVPVGIRRILRRLVG